MCKKDFTYTVSVVDGGVIAQEIITFGSEERPFPDDWEEQPIIISNVMDIKDEVVDRYIKVDVKETVQSDFGKDITHYITEEKVIEMIMTNKDKIDSLTTKEDIKKMIKSI